MHVYYIIIRPRPNTRALVPGVMKFTNFVRPLLGRHNYKLSLSVLCLGVEKNIFKEIMHSHYVTYSATPQQKNHCLGSGGHEIYNFGRPFLDHH